MFEDCKDCLAEKQERELVINGLDSHVFAYRVMHEDVLREVESKMSDKDRIELENKLLELASTIKFQSFDSRLMFEKAFRFGYFANRARKIL